MIRNLMELGKAGLSEAIVLDIVSDVYTSISILLAHVHSCDDAF